MTQQREEKEFIYFQYLKNLELPIYLKLEMGAPLGELPSLILSYGFSALSAEEVVVAEEQLQTRRDARLLAVGPALPGVERQIRQGLETDRYGAESLTPRKGYKVYRHKNLALMIYSLAAREWTMGVVSAQCGAEYKDSWRLIFNRYLSWALAPLGFVGFFGLSLQEGCLVLGARESLGECVFVDVRKARVLSTEGERALVSGFKFIRLGMTLKGRPVRMSKEDLFSFLCLKASYFDYEGLPVPVRQMIQVLARTVDGVVEPRETLNPHTHLIGAR